MRRLTAVLLTLGLAAVGAQGAHVLTYRVAEPHSSARERLLTETGHEYLRLAPVGLTLILAVVALALIWEAAGVRAGRRGAPLRATMFLSVAPATFILQEHVERLLHDGAFPWSAIAEPTFVMGLLLQAPFALLAYGLGRLLLGVAHAAGRLLVRPCRRWPASVRVHHFACLLERALACKRPLGPRGPPLLVR